jgi:predicted Zn finger-like uncharacterized protein
MKFLCPNCKAKYQISDEKISGRTLKMDCRRCNHPIVIRGDAMAAEVEPAPPSSAGRSTPGTALPARRRGDSQVGPAPTSRSSARISVGPEVRKSTPGSSPALAKPTSLDQWHVAINDVPVGPMKREEVAQKIAAGAIGAESLAWREGFDDWRPVKEIPDLAELLRKPVAAPPPPLRTLGKTPPPAAARPARPPAASPPRSAPAAPRPEAARPPSRSNVVPLAARASAAAPALDDFTQDEPTRVGAALDLEALEEEKRLAEEARAKREADEAREREARDREEREAAEAREREARAAAKAEREREERERAKPVATVAEDDAFDPFAAAPDAPPAAVTPVATPAAVTPVATPAVTPVATPAVAPTPALAVPATPVRADDGRRGLPVGAWIAIAGAMAFGVTLAIMVGIKMFEEPRTVVVAPPPTPTPTPTPTPPTPPEPALVVPEPDPTPAEAIPTAPAPSEVVAAAPEATETEPAQNAAGGSTPRSTGPRSPATTTSPASTPTTPRTGGSTPALNAEDAERLRQMEEDSSSGSTLAVRERTNLLGDSTSRQQRQELTADQIRSVVNRERNTVQRCYETAARRTGQSPRVRVDVDVTISGSGTVTSAMARGQSFDNLTECIESNVRRWRFPATGAESAASLPFVFQGRE